VLVLRVCLRALAACMCTRHVSCVLHVFHIFSLIKERCMNIYQTMHEYLPNLSCVVMKSVHPHVHCFILSPSIYTCVCVCACVCICVCVCVCVCVWAYKHACAVAYTQTCSCKFTRIVPGSSWHGHRHTYTNACINAHARARAYTSTVSNSSRHGYTHCFGCAKAE
jgi:hypothetical protein